MLTSSTITGLKLMSHFDCETNQEKEEVKGDGTKVIKKKSCEHSGN